MGAALLASVWLPMSSLWHSSQAQLFTQEEISNYAAAVLALEEIRIQAYTDISDVMIIAKEDVTRHDLRCLNADGLTQLPRSVRAQVRRLVVNYCNQARQRVEDSGLTPELFNVMTQSHREDEALADQIQSEIVNLR